MFAVFVLMLILYFVLSIVSKIFIILAFEKIESIESNLEEIDKYITNSKNDINCDCETKKKLEE